MPWVNLLQWLLLSSSPERGWVRLNLHVKHGKSHWSNQWLTCHLVIELWEFLNSLHKKHETADQEVCGKLREALDALLQECSADNWDGYGAKALPFGSYREALRFIQSLPTTIPVPELAADPDGAIAFEWDNGPRRIFSISVGDNGELIYAGIFGNSKTHGTEFFESRYWSKDRH